MPKLSGTFPGTGRSADLEAMQSGVAYNFHAHKRAQTSPAAPRWDYCVLTAANERQAAIYSRELQQRKEQGFFPRETQVLVCADPQGLRIGSGAATLYVLREIAAQLWQEAKAACRAVGRLRPSACTPPQPGGVQAPALQTAGDLFAGKRILVLHAGGDSRRLPHCSALGKVLATLPTTLPNGEIATLLDILFISLAGIAPQIDEGLVVSSGDSVLTFDPRRLDLRLPGVIGVAMRAGPEQASRHGVYAVGKRLATVKQYLQKPSVEEMQAAGCLDRDGMAQLDSGLFKFDHATVEAFLELAGVSLHVGSRGAPSLQMTDCPLGASEPQELSVDLYREIALALPSDVTRDQYLKAMQKTSGPTAIHERIWEHLRGRRTTPFHVQPVRAGLFTHIGSTASYLSVTTEPSAFSQLYGFTSTLDSHVPAAGQDVQTGRDVCLYRSIPRGRGSIGDGTVLEDSDLRGDFDIGAGALVSGVATQETLRVPAGTALYALPILFAGEDGQAQPAEVSFVYGTGDNPKLTLDDPDCTFLGQPFAKWLAERKLSEDLLWDADEPRTLWTARLFPVGERQQSWQQVAWMYDAQIRPRDIAAWRKSPRTSLQEAFNQADLPAIVQRRQQHTALVHCLRFEEAAGSDIDVRGLFHQVQSPGLYEAVLRHLVGTAHGSDNLLLRGRLLKIAVDLLAGGVPEGVKLDPLVCGSCDSAAAAEHLTGLAFDCVRLKVRSLLGVSAPEPVKPTELGQWLLARCPVRADFASGWSDTPPKSLERGGIVVNAAINLRGEPSLRVWGRRIPEPVLRLHSRDQRASLTISELDELATCNDPLQPMGLHKAAFFACGLIPEGADVSLRRRLEDLGGGFELVTESCVPRGSGVGASSILGATVLACLAELAGQATDQPELFSQVLYLEQLLSTGGGWQDQVGGVVGGVKLIRAYPSAPLDLDVERLALSPEVVQQLHERCLLLYTGRTRLAKNVLRAVMGRYMSRELSFVRASRGIQELGPQMREALLAGDLDEFGWLLWVHWELLKILAPESTTPGIERLLEEVQPYIAGARVLGAGGGGFMLLVAKKANMGLLRQRLHALGAGSGARVYDFELSQEGLTITPCSERDVPGARARAASERACGVASTMTGTH